MTSWWNLSPSEDEKHCRGIGTAGGDLQGAFNGMLRRLGLGQVVNVETTHCPHTVHTMHDTSVRSNTAFTYACTYAHVFGFACVWSSVNLFGSQCCPGPLNLFWRNLASNQKEDGSVAMHCPPLSNEAVFLPHTSDLL